LHHPPTHQQDVRRTAEAYPAKEASQKTSLTVLHPLQDLIRQLPGLKNSRLAQITINDVLARDILLFFPDEPRASTTNMDAETPGVSPLASSDYLQGTSKLKDSNGRLDQPHYRCLQLDDIAWARSPTLVEFQTGHEVFDTQAVLKRISKNISSRILAGSAGGAIAWGEE